MKTLRLILAACALALAGCSTITKDITKQVKLVRDSFNSLLPPDFNGPVDLGISDMYVTARIRATGVHKLDSGEWSWSSVNYDGSLTIPWFAGLTYKRDVKFSIGTPALDNGTPLGAPTMHSTIGTVTSTRPTTLVSPGTITTTVTTAPTK